jgi:hypothetical protein
MRAGLERAAAGAARATLRWAVEGAVSALDLTELVRAHVDLDELAAAIDVDAVVARADVDAVVARTDLDAALDRLDLDAVVARVDLEAVLARLDLPAITREVIDAIDLPEILRQSSRAVSSQAARSVRAEGMSADESVARFVDRILRRPHPRGAVCPVSTAVAARAPIRQVSRIPGRGQEGSPCSGGLGLPVWVRVVQDDRTEHDVLQLATGRADDAPQQAHGKVHAGDGAQERPDSAQPGQPGGQDPQAEQPGPVGPAGRGPGDRQVDDGYGQECTHRERGCRLWPPERHRGPREADTRGRQVHQHRHHDDHGHVHTGGQDPGHHTCVRRRLHRRLQDRSGRSAR